MNAVPNVSRIASLRRELSVAEQELREKAACEAERLAQAERITWREARESCLQLERIRRSATVRLKAIVTGSRERFPGERELAEMALREVDGWGLWDSTAYTVISFAGRRGRFRFLRGGAEREAVIGEAVKRGGVYNERGHFIEVLR
jgi:hypothetical protein